MLVGWRHLFAVHYGVLLCRFWLSVVIRVFHFGRRVVLFPSFFPIVFSTSCFFFSRLLQNIRIKYFILFFFCITALGLEHFDRSINSERHTATSYWGSLAFSADFAPTTAFRTPRLSRRHNVRASRRLCANKRRLVFAGAVQWTTNNERLAHRVMFETMAGGVNPGRGRPERTGPSVW